MIDLSKLTRGSKHDPIPGLTTGTIDRNCPVCGKTLAKFKPCCGNPDGFIGCVDPTCGYKETS
jgi:hypothetical protein